MKQIGKKTGYTLICSVIFSFLLYSPCRASHIMGADMSYSCIGNNQYVVTLRLYRDCCGIPVGQLAAVEIFNGCNLTSFTTVSLPLQPDSGIEVSELCPSALSLSTCHPLSGCPANPSGANPSYPGVQLYTYQDTITLPGPCSQWYLRYVECCRNNTISNVAVGGGSSGMGIQVLINNTTDSSTGQSYCVNSTQFDALPVPFICLSSDFTYNHLPHNPDNDSLVYSLVDPLDENFAAIAFSSGWTSQNPVRTSPSNSFLFDARNGQISFHPAYQEVDVLAIEVKQYRNGVLVGSTVRDMEITVLPCTVDNPEIGSFTNVSDALVTDTLTLRVCPGSAAQFDIPCVNTSNTGIVVTSNVNLLFDTISVSTYVHGDTSFFHVITTPSLLDSGKYYFSVVAQNADCPITGRSTKTYCIDVEDGVTIQSSASAYCGNLPVQLTAVGGNSFSWTPATGLSSTGVANPTATPQTATTYTVTSDCGTDSVLVNVFSPFTAFISGNDTMCAGSSTNLFVNVDSSALPYHFHWSPSTGLRGELSGLPTDSDKAVVALPAQTTTYVCYITGSNGCLAIDTTTVVVKPAENLVAIASPYTICRGQTVSLYALNAPRDCGLAPDTCNGVNDNGQVGLGTGQIPTGAPTQYPTVYGHYKKSAHHQFLFYAYELNDALGGGATIEGISFYISQLNTQNDSIHNFEIKMGCTGDTALNDWVNNLVTVSPAQTVYINATGVKSHAFEYPYNWDGVSNLVVDICFSDSIGGTLNAKMRMTPTTFTSVRYATGNYDLCGSVGNPTTSLNRPNIVFNICRQFIKGVISWSPYLGPNGVDSAHVAFTTAHPSSGFSMVYNVNVTDTVGCYGFGYAYVNINSRPAVPVITDSLNVLTSTQAYAYQWYFNGQIINGATNQSHAPVEGDGSYTVVVSNVQGCSDTSAPFVITAIDNITTGAAFNIYPNPVADGSVFVDVTENLLGTELDILNTEGQKVAHTKLTAMHSAITLNLAAGIYLVKISAEHYSGFKRLIKL